MTPWRKPELWLIVCGKHTPGPLESRGLIEKGSKFQFLLACWCPIVVLKAMFPLLYVSFIPRGRSCIVCGTVMGKWMLLWSFSQVSKYEIKYRQIWLCDPSSRDTLLDFGTVALSSRLTSVWIWDESCRSDFLTESRLRFIRESSGELRTRWRCVAFPREGGNKISSLENAAYS